LLCFAICYAGVSITLTLFCTPAYFNKPNVTFIKLGTNDVNMTTSCHYFSPRYNVFSCFSLKETENMLNIWCKIKIYFTCNHRKWYFHEWRSLHISSDISKYQILGWSATSSVIIFTLGSDCKRNRHYVPVHWPRNRIAYNKGLCRYDTRNKTCHLESKVAYVVTQHLQKCKNALVPGSQTQARDVKSPFVFFIINTKSTASFERNALFCP